MAQNKRLSLLNTDEKFLLMESFPYCWCTKLTKLILFSVPDAPDGPPCSVETCPANSHCVMINAKCRTECACDKGYESGVDEGGSLSCRGKGVRGSEGVFVIKASGMDREWPGPSGGGKCACGEGCEFLVLQR